MAGDVLARIDPRREQHALGDELGAAAGRADRNHAAAKIGHAPDAAVLVHDELRVVRVEDREGPDAADGGPLNGPRPATASASVSASVKRDRPCRAASASGCRRTRP